MDTQIFGNYLGLHVAFSVNFIFGSIFAILAVATMGLWWGIGVSYDIQPWG